jgi:hypothetical protein
MTVLEEETTMTKLMCRLLMGFTFACLLGWSGNGAFPQAGKKADTSKYGKYIISDIIRRIPEYGGTSLLSHEGELKADVSLGYHPVTKPILFGDTHSHSNAELLCFIGGNPLDITDLGAEIDMSLGAEHEKHLITKTSCVSIPPNLPHCPLNIRKVTKPIIFLEISLTRSYKAAKSEPAPKK